MILHARKTRVRFQEVELCKEELCSAASIGDSFVTTIDAHVNCGECRDLLKALYKKVYPMGCKWTPWDTVPVGQRVSVSVYTGVILEAVNNGYGSRIEGFWRIVLDKPIRVGQIWRLQTVCFPAPALEPIDAA